MHSLGIALFLLSLGYLAIGDHDEPEQKWSEWKDQESVNEGLS